MELIEKVCERGQYGSLDRIFENYRGKSYRVVKGVSGYEGFKEEVINWLDELNTEDNELEEVLLRSIMVKFGHLQEDELLGEGLSDVSMEEEDEEN